MSSLFKDASSTLQYGITPPRHASSNTKKLRIPLSQSRFTRFGNGHAEYSSPLPTVPHECDSDDKILTPKYFEQECETLDLLPICGDRPQSSSHCRVANGTTVHRSLIDIPPPSINLNSTRFAATYQANYDACYDLEAREPISSGFSTPVHCKTTYTKKVTATPTPKIRSWEAGQLPSDVQQSDSDDEEHSTHGVRLIMPYTHCEAEEAQQASIEAWLEHVLGSTDESAHKGSDSCRNKIDGQEARDTKSPGESAFEKNLTGFETEVAHDDRLPYRHLSNKENIPPPLPPRVPPPPYDLMTQTQSLSQLDACQAARRPQSSPSIIRFKHPLTPSTFLSAPPKRKKLHENRDVSTPSKSTTSCVRDFTVHDDDLAAALAKLSPCVEQHRKGRGPKRERCASYWDTDVLQPGSPAYTSRDCSEPVDGQGKLLRSGKRVTTETTP